MLIDTDVLIWALRGNLKAARALDGATERAMSVVSYMELIQGARDRQELRTIKAFLQAAEIQLLPLSERIGHRASIYVEEYGLGTALGVANALIAATAVETNRSLCTANQKHYRVIQELELQPFRP